MLVVYKFHHFYFDGKAVTVWEELGSLKNEYVKKNILTSSTSSWLAVIFVEILSFVGTSDTFCLTKVQKNRNFKRFALTALKLTFGYCVVEKPQ